MRALVLVLLLALVSPLFAASPAPAASAEADPLAALEKQIEASPPNPGLPPLPVHHTAPEEHTHPVPHYHHEAHDIFFAFRADFMQRAILAGVLASFACAWLGVFVVLRRMVFVGIGLAEVASAGVALGVYMDWPPVTVALIATVAFSAFAGVVRLRGQITPEARIGLVYVVAGAVAVILLARSGTGEAEQLEMLQGSLLTISGTGLAHLALLAVTVAVTHAIGYRRLVAVSFDPLTAHVAGVSVFGWNLVLFLLLGAGISISLQGCGLLLVFGYLLIPSVTGLVSGLRLPGVFVIALTSAAASTVIGLWLAFEWDWPPGPAIVVVMAAVLIATGILRSLFRGR